MTYNHEPAPDFVSHLEWQLRTALRREDRFSAPMVHHQGGKMKAVALIMVSALLGAGGVVANDEWQEARDREILIAEVTSNIELATLELDVLMERMEEMTRRFRVGVIDEETLRAAGVALREAEVGLATLQLDLEEIRVSGMPPRNEVSAPLVGGRDFVTERLALQQSTAEVGRDLAHARWVRLQDLVTAGAINSRELDQEIVALQEAESHLERVHVKIDLRRRFLKEGMGPEAAERELGLLETQLQMDLARTAMDEAIARYTRMETLVGQGMARDDELTEARIKLVQLEIELGRLQRKLEILRSMGSSADPG
jgi:multidrug resistance efflux pump